MYSVHTYYIISIPYINTLYILYIVDMYMYIYITSLWYSLS